jgi:UDP-N-acetylmuramoylalanine-D-glutamate ligase
MDNPNQKKKNITVVGLGKIGLTLATVFAGTKQGLRLAEHFPASHTSARTQLEPTSLATKRSVSPRCDCAGPQQPLSFPLYSYMQVCVFHNP